MVHVGEEFAACAGQGHASAQQVTGGAHLGRGDRGLREHPAAQQLLARLEKTHSKGKALTILAHTLARAVSSM